MLLEIRKDIVTILAILVAWLPNPAIAKKALPFIDKLKFDQIHHSQISPIRDVAGIYRNNNILITVPEKSNFFITTNYQFEEKESYKAFGNKFNDFANSERKTFHQQVGTGRWRSVLPFAKNSHLFLDGEHMRIIAMELEKDNYISSQSIVLDLIQPAKDSRGEPTDHEIRAYRNQFKKSLLNIRRQKIKEVNTPKIQGIKQDFQYLLPAVGMALLPDNWRHGEKAQFIIASQLEGFPLMTMYCSPETLTNCQIERGCFLDKKKPLQASSLNGIAISAKRKLLLLGDSDKHEINVFQYLSCHQIKYLGAIKLPRKVFRLHTIFIDHDDQLWIGTQKPDNYLNASLYNWKSGNW